MYQIYQYQYIIFYYLAVEFENLNNVPVVISSRKLKIDRIIIYNAFSYTHRNLFVLTEKKNILNQDVVSAFKLTGWWDDNKPEWQDYKVFVCYGGAIRNLIFYNLFVLLLVLI